VVCPRLPFQRRGIDHERFNRDWQQALGIITAALIAQRVPVR